MSKRKKCSISEAVEDKDCILSPVKVMDLWILFPLESAVGLYSPNRKTAVTELLQKQVWIPVGERSCERHPRNIVRDPVSVSKQA